MTVEQEAYIRERWDTETGAAIARTLGLHKSTVQKWIAKNRPVAFERSLDVPYIATPDDLLRVMQVDLDHWEIARLRVNAWGTDGQSHQVRAELKPKASATFEALKAGLLEDLRIALPPAEPREYTAVGCLKEVSIPDLHLGKRGHNYSADEAERLFRWAVEALLAQSSGIATERFLLPISNDFLHADNQRHQTTGGTPMDVDVFFVEMFRRGWRLLRWAVERLLEEAPVDVVVVPGNHDYESGFAMGELVYALYESHPHVSVDNSLDERKYYDYGKTLLGFTHGHTGRLQELPLYMADEAPQLWARCPYREWHLGHKHRKREHRWVSQDELRGVRLRELPSLSPADRWHYREGYNHWRAAEMYVWHPETSFSALFSVSPEGSGHEYLHIPH